jgi:excisionase family DNA binding protein
MLNKAQAAEFLGVTPRAVENYVAQGKLHVQYAPGLRGRIALFNEAELQRLKDERAQAPYLDPKVIAQALFPLPLQQPQPQVPPQPPEPQPLLVSLLEGLRELLKEPAVRSLLTEAVKAAFQNWQESERVDQTALSIKEASEATGLSESTIRRDIREGVLKAKFKGRGYLIRRADLQRYFDEEWED